jgi:hypothetical protein
MPPALAMGVYLTPKAGSMRECRPTAHTRVYRLLVNKLLFSFKAIWYNGRSTVSADGRLYAAQPIGAQSDDWMCPLPNQQPEGF